MTDRSVPDARRALVVVGLVFLLGLPGCVSQDEAGAADPGSLANQTQDDPGDPPDATPSNTSAEPGNQTPKTNGSDANPVLSQDLVWATNTALVRWDHGTQNLSRIGPGDAVGNGTEFTALAWGTEGSLYATTMPASTGPGGTGALTGPSATLLRVDVSSGETETVHEGPPLVSPLGLTVLEDGRVLVADRGELGWPPQGAPSPSGRVVEIGSDGSASVLTTDPRFHGWMDVHAVDGEVFLTTQTDQRLLAPSTSDGTGALWTVDPQTGAHALASASSTFQAPSGIAASSQGLYLTEWDGQRLLQVDPSSGEAGVVSPVEGSQNLWGLDRLPDGRLVASGVGGVWLVDPGTGDATRLLEPGSGTPRHVRGLGPG